MFSFFNRALNFEFNKNNQTSYFLRPIYNKPPFEELNKQYNYCLKILVYLSNSSYKMKLKSFII